MNGERAPCIPRDCLQTANIECKHTTHRIQREGKCSGAMRFPLFFIFNSATARFERAHHTLNIQTNEKLNCRGFGYKTRRSAENGLTNFSSRLLRILEGKMNGVHFVHFSGQFHFFFFGAALITLSKCCGLRCWDICDFFLVLPMPDYRMLLLCDASKRLCFSEKK